MILLEPIKRYYPPQLSENASFQKYILKEYLQLLILDYLSATPFVEKIVFIGGTNLRLVKGIDRFSEDLDFDCKGFSKVEFTEMTDNILIFLRRSGIRVEAHDQEKERLKAFRRNIHFPELLFDLGLTGHREERFLIKVESQDQQITYDRTTVNIKGCGFYFPFPVPTDGVMCAMKLSAMLSRQKGRDFYDAMFLLAQSDPDYSFLAAKLGIHNLEELKAATEEMLTTVDLNIKKRDFEHLLFNKKKSESILAIGDFIREMK
ncbi:MAG: nucleotidyl transferase AbiEii/AbiGii toxin family protein [Prolixibacteraceae bacterium]|jgi:predicted nucleotidyltransferase component of viral defense system|nr:nucleotidyl transferase AbiEii/AbiGii toxin family protein [Prolixibacteraceae bacterium]